MEEEVPEAFVAVVEGPAGAVVAVLVVADL